MGRIGFDHRSVHQSKLYAGPARQVAALLQEAEIEGHRDSRRLSGPMIEAGGLSWLHSAVGRQLQFD
jgi:hypothetical protein